MLDLHTHTTRSDGTTSPAELVALAAAEGLAGIALTDHDTTAGWAEAAAACARHGLEFVPGLELSTEFVGPDGAHHGVHLLGYWVDAGDPALVTECERLRNERVRRARAIVARLRVLGVEIAWEAVLARAGDAPVGRPHIAAAMVDAGVVADLDDAFAGYLADGGPAYVPKHALSPERGVALIRGAGGVAVLAHPGVSADQVASPGVADHPTMVDLVDRLVPVGLVAVEADHAGHDEATTAFWHEVAAQRRLLVTGSSDFHGRRKDVRLGARATPVATVRRLRHTANGAATPAVAAG